MEDATSASGQHAGLPTIFPDSSFFKERRAPTLPTPAEIRAMNLETGDIRATYIRRPPPVVVPRLRLLVKYGSDVTRGELETQMWVREKLLGRVPIPEIFGWAEDSQQGFIYMALVDGNPLQERWVEMSEAERLSICKELRGMAQAWRKLTPETLGHYIGSKGNRPLNEIFLRNNKELTGPFQGPSAVSQFHEGCSIHIAPDHVATVFTHDDLVAPNILLSPGPGPKVAAIIDWAQAGWYPAYWEFCKAKLVRIESEVFNDEVQEEWATKYLPTILDPVDDETCYYPWLYFVLSKGI